jgi:hypothetical protein
MADRRGADVSRSWVTLRDGIVAAASVAAMWGTQVATQAGMRSDLRDLKTSFDAVRAQQVDTNGILQRQIDEVRKTANLALVNDAETSTDLATLRGYLEGLGVKVPSLIGKGAKK